MITVNTVHPGIVRTDSAQDTFRLRSLIYRLLKYIIAISKEKAAFNIVHALIDKNMKNITAACIKKQRLAKFNLISDNTELRKKLWNISIKLGQLPESFKI